MQTAGIPARTRLCASLAAIWLGLCTIVGACAPGAAGSATGAGGRPTVGDGPSGDAGVAGRSGGAGGSGGTGGPAAGRAGDAGDAGDAPDATADLGSADLGSAVRDAPPTDTEVEAGAPAGWSLVWSDEFAVDGPPDPKSWGFETGFVRNLELQWYQSANATVAGGVLTIEGRRERVPNPSYQGGSADWRVNRAAADYTSASMTTAGKRTFTYGRFEARARIDIRQGSWPAFWTLGTTGGWPGGGEVDIMEFYAGKVLANVCRPAGGTCGWSSVSKPVASLGADFASQFHLWAMEWSATSIDLFLDGTLVNHFNVADAVAAGASNPYVAKPVYILLNLALGANGGDPSATTFPMKYEVDYVRVYARAP